MPKIGRWLYQSDQNSSLAHLYITRNYVYRILYSRKHIVMAIVMIVDHTYTTLPIITCLNRVVSVRKWRIIRAVSTMRIRFRWKRYTCIVVHLIILWRGCTWRYTDVSDRGMMYHSLPIHEREWVRGVDIWMTSTVPKKKIFFHPRYCNYSDTYRAMPIGTGTSNGTIMPTLWQRNWIWQYMIYSMKITPTIMIVLYHHCFII